MQYKQKIKPIRGNGTNIDEDFDTQSNIKM